MIEIIAWVAFVIYLLFGAAVGIVAFLVDAAAPPRHFRWWHFPICAVAWPLFLKRL